jgi:hypothetical protein
MVGSVRQHIYGGEKGKNIFVSGFDGSVGSTGSFFLWRVKLREVETVYYYDVDFCKQRS